MQEHEILIQTHTLLSIKKVYFFGSKIAFSRFKFQWNDLLFQFVPNIKFPTQPKVFFCLFLPNHDFKLKNNIGGLAPILPLRPMIYTKVSRAALKNQQ
jgi:hypothetical protein